MRWDCCSWTWPTFLFVYTGLLYDTTEAGIDQRTQVAVERLDLRNVADSVELDQFGAGNGGRRAALYSHVSALPDDRRAGRGFGQLRQGHGGRGG